MDGTMADNLVRKLVYKGGSIAQNGRALTWYVCERLRVQSRNGYVLTEAALLYTPQGVENN